MRASDWLLRDFDGVADVAFFGAPISRASISPSEAWSTPAAFRGGLARFPTWDASHHVDLEPLRVLDLGDVEGDREDPDAGAAHGRIEAGTVEAYERARIVVAIGGDNSLTRPAMRGAMTVHDGEEWGLLTLDAHHDCRPVESGSRNGTPVRELIEGGLPGRRVAQIGIHPLGNQREHADWAIEQGVNVYGVDRVRALGMRRVVDDALRSLRTAGARRLWVDFDVDVVDRAFAPACPASMPGGLAPGDLLEAAFLLGRDAAVLGADLCEVDANADVNGMTVRLMGAAFLEFCCGVSERLRHVAAGR